MSTQQLTNIDRPFSLAARSVSREAERHKVVAAERSIAFVRLGIVAFGIFVLTALTPPAQPWVAWGVLIVAAVYSLWILRSEPYQRHPFLLSKPFTTLADGVLILFWLFSTGGLDSNTFVIIYAAIVSVAYRYGQRETVLATAGYSVGYLLMGLLMGQVEDHVSDLIVRIIYFIFVGVLSARFSGEALIQLQAKIELRDLARDLERESAERQRAEQALARYAEQLEARINERTEALRHAKEQVETILDSTSDGIVFSRLDGQIVHVNPAFCRMFGYDSADLLDRRLQDLISANDAEKVNEAMRSFASGRCHARFDVSCLRKDGSVWEAEVAMTAAFAGETIGTGVISSLRDITERKKIEKGLRAAIEKQRQLNELKTRFVSMVSHEFRTPLTSIHVAIDLLDRHDQRLEQTRKRELANRVRGHIAQMTAMLDDVLMIGRAETVGANVELAMTDLEALCRDVVVEMQNTTRTRTLLFTRSGASRPVRVDAQLIRRALLNLLTNAIKYSPDDSQVDIGLEFEENEVRLWVQDRGIGIPEEDQEHLFEAFHRAANVGATQGTGLGLTIVKQAVDVHGGSVSVDSRLGAGTRVTITLPLDIKPAK